MWTDFDRKDLMIMGHTPYGYRIENGNAVIEPKEAEAIVKMCEGYLDGLSLKAAAETAGIVATHCQAKRMMQNEKYLGTDYYPAILTRDVIDKVKAELEDLRMFIDIGEGTITESETEDKDWINNWKKSFIDKIFNT